MVRNQDKFKIRVKTALVRKGMSITELARRIERSRSKTSIAINHGGYPIVSARIRKALQL